MKFFFNLIILILMTKTFTFAQTAAVDLSLAVADNASGSRVLKFGLDLTATTGIDPHLGESDLPPFPPEGAFEARWSLSPFGVGTLSTYQDYRNTPSFPFTGQITHRLVWQYSEFATQMSFTYNLPPEATLLITSNNATPIWTSGTLTGSGTYVLPDTDNEYSAARVYVNYDAILPVELTSFTSSVIGSTVQLNWSTASEINNSGFDIERKLQNSSEWQKIGFVPGAGTTAQSQSYVYTDNPGIGMYDYRLRQVDFDGTFAYSQIVSSEVGAPTEFELNQNYPNPFNPSTLITFQIPFEAEVALNIYNLIGQKVDELVNGRLSSGVHSINWNASKYSTGVYYYEIIVGEFKSTKKMTFLK